MKIAKDKLFDTVNELKIKINEVMDSIDEQDGYMLTNRNNIGIISQNMSEIKKEHHGILSHLQEHALKINGSGTISSRKSWMLQSDTYTDPILKVYENTAKFALLAPLLSPIKLDGDKMMDIKKFYEEINVAMMTTLSTMIFLPDYKDLTSSFDIRSHLIPPSVHTQNSDAENAYKQFIRTLLLHIQKSTTINTNTAARAAMILQENMLDESGFVVLSSIIKELSPQFGK